MQNRSQDTSRTNESFDIQTGEINDRLSRELDSFKGSVRVQIQRAIEGAITGEGRGLSQIRLSLRPIEESVGTRRNFGEELELRSEELQTRDQKYSI